MKCPLCIIPPLSHSSVYIAGVVHEHPRIGSDGESEEGSGTSEDPNVSPGSEDLSTSVSGSVSNHTSLVKLRQKPGGGRKLSNQEEINKRLSLPADMKIPENFISRQTVSPTLEGPLSRYVTKTICFEKVFLSPSEMPHSTFAIFP